MFLRTRWPPLVSLWASVTILVRVSLMMSWAPEHGVPNIVTLPRVVVDRLTRLALT